MEDHTEQAEALAPLQLVGEGIHRAAPVGRRRGGQVDEVARVGEDPGDADALPGRREGAGVPGRERGRRPLPLVLEEDLYGAAAEGVAAFQGPPETPGDRQRAAPPPST